MPVDRHRIGAEPHRRIGRLDEGDVVAHQYADVVALLDAKPLQSAGDARGAIGDFGVTMRSLTADDAEEEGWRGHDLFRSVLRVETTPSAYGTFRHCEERSDEAIQSFAALDCFAALAMTIWALGG